MKKLREDIKYKDICLKHFERNSISLDLFNDLTSSILKDKEAYTHNSHFYLYLKKYSAERFIKVMSKFKMPDIK